MQTAANVASLTFEVEGLGEDDLRVVRMEGSEQLGALFGYRLELCSPRSDLRPPQMLKAAARLEIGGPRGVRTRRGIIRSFECLGSDATWHHYAVEFVPVHWLLGKRVGSRIFQAHNCEDMTVPGIVSKVFRDAGLPEESFRFVLHGDYEARDYVVQYRESELDFALRLLEEEGIFIFFEETEHATRMVLADHPDAHPQQPDGFELRAADSLEREDDDWFTRLHERGAIEHGAVTLDDFSFRQPGQDLAVTRAGDDFATLPHSDYPGRFSEREAGERLAGIRLEAWQAARHRLELQGDVRSLAAGDSFTLDALTNPQYDGQYVVVGLRLSAHQPQSLGQQVSGNEVNTLRVVFEVLPATTPFRPQQTTPRPTVRGSQTAIVVGPQEEEIYTDQYGRVKVQFPWDGEGTFNENSSCWIRVSQGSAGGQYGMLFLPRVGHEVIVDFLEGNPDRPIITGRVYNRDQMPPYTLPEEKTRSGIKTHSSKGGGGANEICFEDAKDNEQLSLFAERDLHVRTKRDRVETTSRSLHERVGGSSFEQVAGHKHLYIKKDQTKVVRGKSIECFQDHRVILTEMQSMQRASEQWALKADQNVVIDADQGITLKCGGNFITIDQSGIWLNGTHVGLNSGGSAIPIVEPEWELDLKSPRSADKNTPGQDTRYDGGGDQPRPIEPGPNNDDDDPTDDDKKTSWIEIEMVDELGRPWKGEAYEIEEPDGKIHKGSLDQDGRAHVRVADPGVCQIRFPKLDAATWRRSQ